MNHPSTAAECMKHTLSEWAFKKSCQILLILVLEFDLSELEPGDTAVIKEIYDSENAQEIFEIELERALQVNCWSKPFYS